MGGGDRRDVCLVERKYRMLLLQVLQLLPSCPAYTWHP
jgi:hypothetical protein